jgi:hypothetical protein
MYSLGGIFKTDKLFSAMDVYKAILEDNEKKCAAFVRTNAKKVLILYRDSKSFIGDLCLRLDKMWHIKDYFPNAILDFNFSFAEQLWLYDGLLRNSPYINKLFSAGLEDCDFSEYDLIIYVDADEMNFLNVLFKRHEQYDSAGKYVPPIFSMTKTIFRVEKVINVRFPLYEDLIATSFDITGELYISGEERDWAEKWLRDRGVNEGDSVVAVLDTASEKHKLLRLPVYFEFLQFLLRGKRAKVLNFDERGIGKEDFYRAWLGSHSDKMIFSKNLPLREALCILSARYMTMIFGPCTGLLHCTSAIYNYYQKRGMSKNDIPIMITYTGNYPVGQDAAGWWRNAPLIDCIMLKSTDKTCCRLVKLSDLPPEEQLRNDSLSCSHYTADHLINFVKTSFQERSASLW